jgi:hypothetical protein
LFLHLTCSKNVLWRLRDQYLSPTKVADGIVQVAEYAYGFVALKQDGSLWAWPNEKKLQVGGDDIYTLALKTDGTL